MKAIRVLRASLVVCATWTLFVPAPVLAIEKRSSKPLDVQLTAGQRLIGQVVDSSGQPVAEHTIILQRGLEPLAETVTDEDGRFQFSDVSGGAYQVVVGEQATACRCWAPDTAPPKATSELLVIAGENVQRGQRPIGEMFSNPLVIAALVAGAIAIPIAIHNSGDDDEGS